MASRTEGTLRSGYIDGQYNQPPPRIPFPNFLLLHSSEFNTYHRQSWPSRQQNGIQSARDKLTIRSKASVQSLLSFRTVALPDRVTQSIDAGVGSPIPQHPSSRRYRSGLKGTPNTPKSGRSCPSRLLMAQKGVFLARTLTPTAVRALNLLHFLFHEDLQLLQKISRSEENPPHQAPAHTAVLV